MAYSYCLGIHVDNFWSYQALIFWLFIMDEDFWGHCYYSDLSLCVKRGDAR